MPGVAVEGVLRPSGGLPLVAPHDVETGAIECEMEASDPGEQLSDGRSATGLTTGLKVGIGHAEPFVGDGGRVVPSVADLAHGIKVTGARDSSPVEGWDDGACSTGRWGRVGDRHTWRVRSVSTALCSQYAIARDSSNIDGVAVKVVDAPFGGAAQLLETERQLDLAYRRLLEVLIGTSVPRQRRQKASPLFVYDQRELQKSLRAQLRGLGFSYGRALSPDTTFDGVRVPGIQADMIGDGLHVVLDFGNRASWAHNFLTRVLGGVANQIAQLTVIITPTDGFARRIDTNLGTFERVAASLREIERWRRESLPGPIIVVGVAPDRPDPD